MHLQIFQWLSSMPIELEGYIRPGCTILTMFITMPKLMWAKVVVDWMLFFFFYGRFYSYDEVVSLTRHISVTVPYIYTTYSCLCCHWRIQDRLHSV